MISFEPQHLLLAGLAVLAVLGLVAVVRSTRTQAHQAALAVHSGAVAVSIAGRAVVTAAVIVVVQWLVVTNVDPRSAGYWLVLAVPAVLAGITVARMFTVTTVVRRGGGRR